LRCPAGLLTVILNEAMPKVLDELYRIQRELTELDPHERLILKMCSNLLESHLEVRNPQSRLTEEEYFAVPGRWELQDGMLRDY
jgi:hypothetical protein